VAGGRPPPRVRRAPRRHARRGRPPANFFVAAPSAALRSAPMNGLIILGMGTALLRPLQTIVRARIRSMTLFREAFFWRWQRELRRKAERPA